MKTDNFCFYLQNRLIQTSQTGGQQYSDTSPFSIPWVMNFDDPMANFDFSIVYSLPSLISIVYHQIFYTNISK